MTEGGTITTIPVFNYLSFDDTFYLISQVKEANNYDTYITKRLRTLADETIITDHLCKLATPKDRLDLDKFRVNSLETSWGQHNPVSPAAKTAQCTSHVESLAEPKKYHPRFAGEKPVQWSVDESALKAIANLRLQQLSRPRSRTMIKDDYDPYKVPMAARRAHATPRIEELCLPIPRKVRPKKVV